jgi:hypothetical protein
VDPATDATLVAWLICGAHGKGMKMLSQIQGWIRKLSWDGYGVFPACVRKS